MKEEGEGAVLSRHRRSQSSENLVGEGSITQEGEVSTLQVARLAVSMRLLCSCSSEWLLSCAALGARPHGATSSGLHRVVRSWPGESSLWSQRSATLIHHFSTVNNAGVMCSTMAGLTIICKVYCHCVRYL